eukprot:245019-Rhodomonas_salina.1
MDRPLDSDKWPITVGEPLFEVKSIVQSSPYPAAQNFITVNLEVTEDLANDCDVVITISGLDGACVEDEDNEVGLTDAPFQDTAIWHPEDSSLTIEVSDAPIMKDTEYEFTFFVRNPTSSQQSPAVSIEASGIPIAKISMDKNPAQTPPDDVVDATAKEGEPLEVRGL